MQQTQQPAFVGEIANQLGAQIIAMAEQRQIIAQLSQTAQAALSAMAAAVRAGDVSAELSEVWSKTVPGFAEMQAVPPAAGESRSDPQPGVVHSIKGAKKA